MRFHANLRLKDYGSPRRFAPRSKYPWGAPRNDRTSLSTRWGYFLSRKKVPKERFEGRGISIFCFASGGLLLSVATKVTKSAIQGGRKFRSSFPLENPLSLSDQRGRAAALPLWKHPPGGGGDYQIAPLPRSGKGRWRPLAAVFVNAFALRRKIVQPCISERKRQRKEKQRQCNI